MNISDNAKRIADAGIDRPLSWDEMGSSEKDRWEEAMIAAIERFTPRADPPFAVGDRVKIGAGKIVHEVRSFQANGTALLVSRNPSGTVSNRWIPRSEWHRLFVFPTATPAPEEVPEEVPAPAEIPTPAPAPHRVAIYPAGALLLGPDGTSYRAREARVSMFTVEDGPVQDLVASDLEGRAWLVRAGELPRGVRVIWEPDAEDAVAIVPNDYVEEQGRISIALALVDDLSQEACDLGQNGLAAILAESFHAIEKFHARPSSLK